jgi:hypothetical protein
LDLNIYIQQFTQDSAAKEKHRQREKTYSKLYKPWETRISKKIKVYRAKSGLVEKISVK